MSEPTLTERAEEALLALLAETPFQAIGPRDVASRAGVALADLRRAYDAPIDILAGFARRIDAAVLDGGDAATADEPAKDRLFDVLMRRFDLLAPYRAGLAGLERSARRDPLLAARLGRIVVGSQAWMLEAAGLSAAGPKGAIRAVALAAGLTRVVPVFLAETDAGLPKTMAALDALLDRLGRAVERARRVERALGGVFGLCRSRRAPTATEPAIDPSI